MWPNMNFVLNMLKMQCGSRGAALSSATGKEPWLGNNSPTGIGSGASADYRNERLSIPVFRWSLLERGSGRLRIRYCCLNSLAICAPFSVRTSDRALFQIRRSGGARIARQGTTLVAFDDAWRWQIPL